MRGEIGHHERCAIAPRGAAMPPDEGSEELLDPRALFERLGDDPALLRELANLFHARSAQMLDEVRRAVQAGDPAAVGFMAHALKGAVANFSEGAAFQLALRLEMMGKQGDRSAAAGALRELESAVERLGRALTRLTQE